MKTAYLVLEVQYEDHDPHPQTWNWTVLTDSAFGVHPLCTVDAEVAAGFDVQSANVQVWHDGTGTLSMLDETTLLFGMRVCDECGHYEDAGLSPDRPDGLCDDCEGDWS